MHAVKTVRCTIGRCKMARFDERSGQLYVTELGRVASHFYIRHKSIVAFNELLKPHMSESEVSSAPCLLHAACQCIIGPRLLA